MKCCEYDLRSQSYVEKLARDKHSSLFGLFIRDERKQFYGIKSPDVNVIKLFSFVTDDES